jgi:hypothetical protein
MGTGGDTGTGATGTGRRAPRAARG